MGILIRALVLLFLWPVPIPAWAFETLPAGLAEGRAGIPARVTDGDTLTLADGREVRLVGIQAPKLALGRRGFRTWPLAGAAKAALAEIVGQTRLRLYFGGARKDRHGRVLAHLVRGDGLWVQGTMLARGMARVYSFPDNRAAVAEMLAIERRARAARVGIWAQPFYRIVPHTQAGRYIGSFRLVEGRVHATAVVRGRGYVNFTADWRSDFTIAVPKRALKLFRKPFGRRLERLAGKQVRVRGWLRSYNGPMIEATHPEQIEVLER